MLVLQVWRYPKVEDLYVDDNVYVWSRGPFVIVMTNVGEVGPTTVTNNTVISIQGLPRRFHSSRLRNIYDKQVGAGNKYQQLECPCQQL